MAVKFKTDDINEAQKVFARAFNLAKDEGSGIPAAHVFGILAVMTFTKNLPDDMVH